MYALFLGVLENNKELLGRWKNQCNRAVELEVPSEGFRRRGAGSQCEVRTWPTWMEPLGAGVSPISQRATADMGRMLPAKAFWEATRTGEVREGIRTHFFKSL